LYLGEEKFRTEKVEGKERNPEFNYARQHTQEVVTDNFIKYLKEDSITFKVYGFRDLVNKDGNALAGKK